MLLQLRSPRLVPALLLAGVACLTGPAAAAPTAGFQVDPAQRERLPAGEGLRVHDYGTFLWVLADGAAARNLRAAGHAGVDFSLDLGGARFDPVAGPPPLPPEWTRAGQRAAAEPPPPARDLHLVQWVGPVREAWLEDLRAGDLEVVRTIPPFALAVRGPDPSRILAGHPAVRWSGPFEPAFKVGPAWRGLGPTPLRLAGLVLRGDAEETLEALRGLGATDLASHPVDPTFLEVRLDLGGDRLLAAARLPGVWTLRPVPTDGGLRGEMSDQVAAGNFDGSNVAFPGYGTWLQGLGLSGDGVVMANVDGGIHDTHPDLIGRMLPCLGSTCGGGAASGHGTHTAAIMAGDGASGTLDHDGFLRGLGVAPGAGLIEQRYSPTYTHPGGMLELMRQSCANGAVLSGNSWGPAGTPQGYDNDTLQVDVGVRDADPDTPGNQQLTYVLSFMNGYGGTSSQGTPDEAKNLFNIGSTKMQEADGDQILDIFDLSANSAHGPALDGRTIPHLVAPGCEVDSALTASGYGLECGTSMASPHVSGAVGLFFESYRSLTSGARGGGGSLDPGPALVKAAFLVAARDLEGNRDADGGTLGHPFDSKQGWGQLNLSAVLEPPVAVEYFDQPVLLGGPGEEWEASFSVPSASDPVRLMLVWTDAPGHGLGGPTSAWNNDLDLIVEVGEETYRGNFFAASGFSDPTGPTADRRNNTEGVFLPAGEASAFTVRVQAFDVPSDGVPGNGDDTDQDFALVCTNCTVAPAELRGYPELLRGVGRTAAGAPAAFTVDRGVLAVAPCRAPGIFADGFESGDLSAWNG